MPPCAGCLDDRKCWVCLGTGLVDRPDRTMAPCHRCFGSGTCHVCQPIPVRDVGRTPSLRVPRRWRRGLPDAEPA